MAASENKDPLMEDLDEARQRIFETSDHDPTKVLALYLECQKRYSDRPISRRLPGGER